MNFVVELENLLNRTCQENNSNTPDFILAAFLKKCLNAWDETTIARDRWYGVHLAPGNSHFLDRQVSQEIDPNFYKVESGLEAVSQSSEYRDGMRKK